MQPLMRSRGPRPWFLTMLDVGRCPVVALVVGCALLLGAPPARAQQGSVSGTVVQEQTLRPIAGAQVSVPGTGRGTLTDASGRFTLAGLSGTQATLQVSMIGYRAETRTVAVGSSDVRIALSPSAVELDEVVVTGTPGATTRRSLGNAITTVDAEQLTEVAPVANVQEMLRGRSPGVMILPASGGVGTGSRVRVRGVSSFSLSSQPLIYVDGVRVNNDPASGPANQGFGSSSISRFNDINPEDIETIEIIKGPAAATLYGTEASNGVIQILTKRGKTGDARWNATIRQGANFLANPEGRFWTNYQCAVGFSLSNPCPGDQILSVDIIELEEQRGRPAVFRTGHMQEYDLNVSGGTDRFRYYAAGSLTSDEGAEPSNFLDRYQTRLNLSLTPRDNLRMDLALGYVDGDTRLSAEAGFGGRVWSVVLANPRNLNDPFRRGFHSGTPEAYDALYHMTQGLNRFTGSLQLNHGVTSWLSHRLNLGTDQTREDNVIFFPRVDSLVNDVFGSEALGYKEVEARDIRYQTLDYSATARAQLSGALESSTSVGAQYFTRATDRVWANGSVFPAPGLTALEATTRDRSNTQDFIEEATLGFFAQEQLSLHNRLFLTAGLRADDNSAFGENFDRVFYPKLSASWVVTEEPFWRLGAFNTLRLRAAYGESGTQPAVFAALRTYRPVSGPGDAAAVTPDLIGNPDLGPERGKEIELGFDAGFLEDRLGLEFTYYNKRTTDAILEREIAPSIGFAGFQFFNAGEIRNSGIELLTRARPIQRGNVDWEVTLNFATNDNEVIDLGLQDQEFVTAGTYLRHQIGYPVGSWFEKRVVSAEMDASGRAINAMCDDGSGGSVACANAPAVFLGRTTPTSEGGVTSTLTLFNRLRIYGLVDFKNGLRKMDGNTRVRCTFFGGRCRENFFPEEFDARRIAGIQSNRQLVDFLIDDASYVKLRELSLGYTLPTEWAGRFGASRAVFQVAGRNLHTWTRYGGLEPEAMFLGGSRGGNHSVWEQTTLPQLTSWSASVNLTF